MNTFYEHLYQVYAFPELKSLDSEQEEILRKFIDIAAIPAEKRLDTLDFLQTMRLIWGLESFVLGIQLGEGLATPYDGFDIRQCLLDLLAKLDQPVA